MQICQQRIVIMKRKNHSDLVQYYKGEETSEGAPKRPTHDPTVATKWRAYQILRKHKNHIDGKISTSLVPINSKPPCRCGLAKVHKKDVPDQTFFTCVSWFAGFCGCCQYFVVFFLWNYLVLLSLRFQIFFWRRHRQCNLFWKDNLKPIDQSQWKQ